TPQAGLLARSACFGASSPSRRSTGVCGNRCACLHRSYDWENGSVRGRRSVTMYSYRSWNSAASSCKTLMAVVCLCLPTRAHGQVMITLSEAIRDAEAANRTIQTAALEQEKARREVAVAKTHRLPVFSLTAFGSEPLTQLGVTLE